MAGWVKLWRDVLDHPVFEDPVTFKVFAWCILRAKIEPTSYRGDALQHGQFSTGRNAAASELGMHPSSVYRAFQRLQEMNCITVEANKVRTIVTVCNWSTYQDQQEEERTSSEQEANKPRTSGEQAANTIEESKNLRIQEGEEEYPPTPRDGGSGSAKPPKPRFDPRAVELPAVLRVPLLETAWRDWIEYRREIRKPLTERSCREQLNALARAGPVKAEEAIRTAIRNQWTGVFPEGIKNGGSAPPPGPGQRYDAASVGNELDIVGTL